MPLLSLTAGKLRAVSRAQGASLHRARVFHRVNGARRRADLLPGLFVGLARMSDARHEVENQHNHERAARAELHGPQRHEAANQDAGARRRGLRSSLGNACGMGCTPIATSNLGPPLPPRSTLLPRNLSLHLHARSHP